MRYAGADTLLACRMPAPLILHKTRSILHKYRTAVDDSGVLRIVLAPGAKERTLLACRG